MKILEGVKDMKWALHLDNHDSNDDLESNLHFVFFILHKISHVMRYKKNRQMLIEKKTWKKWESCWKVIHQAKVIVKT